MHERTSGQAAVIKFESLMEQQRRSSLPRRNGIPLEMQIEGREGENRMLSAVWESFASEMKLLISLTSRNRSRTAIKYHHDSVEVKKFQSFRKHKFLPGRCAPSAPPCMFVFD